MSSDPHISTVLLVVVLLLFGATGVAAGDEGDPCSGAELGLQAAEAALDEGRWSDAEAFLQPLVISYTACSGVVVSLARLRAAQDDTAEAERLFSRALTLAPDDAVTHALFARFQLSRGLQSQALLLTTQSLAIEPDCPEGLVVRGQIMGQRGLFGEARAALEKAVALDPTSAEAQHELGVWFFRVKLIDRAARHFETAAALRPQWTQSYVYLALSFEMLGEPERAERAYGNALKANEGPFFDPSLDSNFGRFLLKQGRFEECRTYLDRAVALHPIRRGPRYARAKLHLARGDFQAAREDAERALALGKPGDGVLDLQVYYLLSTIYLRLGEQELAKKFADLARTTEIPEHVEDRRR